MTRPTIDEYLMMVCVAVRSRSTCTKPPTAPLGVGCVIASSDGKILATGYSGSLHGENHCIDVGHYLVNDRCLRTVHAEQNAVAQAASRGISIQKSTVYVTTHPCLSCAKLLSASGAEKILYLDNYILGDDETTRHMVPIPIIAFFGTKFEVRAVPNQ